MRVSDFLAELRAMDIEIWADGDQLRCNAPAGKLTEKMRDQLRQGKPEILAFLRSAVALGDQQRAIVPLQPYGEHVPVFAVAGHNGDVFCYRALVSHLGTNQPFFGLQPPGLDGLSEPLVAIKDLASYFAAQIFAFRPNGPCVIAGYCAGGTVALELASQLVAQGVPVRFVTLFGCPDPRWYRFLPQFFHGISVQIRRVDKLMRALASRSYRESGQYIREVIRQRRAQQVTIQQDPALRLRSRVEEATLTAVRRYTPGYFAGQINVIMPSVEWAHSREGWLRWRSSVAQSFIEYCGPKGCTVDNLLREPYASSTAEMFRRARDVGDGQRSQ